MRRLCVSAVLAIISMCLTTGPSDAGAQQTLSYTDLIQRLSDLSQPAVLPVAGETCRQWSSWDRASRYDESTGKYVNWDANNDGPMFIRQEGESVVMAEMDGPGCIWRIWSAMADKGHVKIYLDGADAPVVDLPFAQYFSGDTAPFNYPMLSYNLNLMGCSGQNLYYPIPYQKSCKIVAEKGWGNYYHVVYTTYPEGTRVPTYSRQLADEHAAQLADLNTKLERRLTTVSKDAAVDEDVEKCELTVAGKATAPVAALSGAAPSRAFACRWTSKIATTRWQHCVNSVCRSPLMDRSIPPSGARWAISSEPHPAGIFTGAM